MMRPNEVSVSLLRTHPKNTEYFSPPSDEEKEMLKRSIACENIHGPSVQKRLVFSDTKEIAETLKRLRKNEELIGVSKNGMIELKPVGNSVYFVEFYDFKNSRREFL